MGSNFWIGIVIFGILYGIVMLFIWKKKMNDTSSYLEKHPNAAKIYVTFKHHLVTEKITIFTINGKKAVHGHLANVYYCESGKDIKLEVSWTYSRPGIFYKSVNKYTDVVELLVDIEAEKNYMLTYNKKEEKFVIKEKE